MDLSETKQREETKRDAAYDPAQRWQHIQDTITWAEANLPYDQRRNRPRVSNHPCSPSTPQNPSLPQEDPAPSTSPKNNPDAA